MQKVADASGAKYSAGSAGPAASSGPPPPIASKPAFNPTRSSAASGFNPLASSRSRPGQNDSNVDEDGWGADAPEVTRSQLEKVAPAYQPTKVNMAELTKQKPEPSRFNGGSRTNDNGGAPEVVKGAYQPVGKVDIAAIRARAQKTGDDRPTIVKGAYEPVGKVDIAAIRARAQKPSDEGVRQLSPAATGASATSNTSDEPTKSLADRSSAFTQSERLTSLPKPKVANRFGSGTSNFTGTKAPTPGIFGLQSAPATAAPAPVGAASRTFADEGGKTPAQIWAEKKARQRGLSGAGDAPSVTSPIASQTSGGGEWKSRYAGKSWAPVATTTTGRSGTGSIGQQRTGEEEREEEAPSSPAGGIGALRDRFKGGAPMGAPSMARSTTEDQSPPPPINSSTRPTGGVPMPGLPGRPRPDEDEEEQDGPNIPPPPRVQRNPTPPTPEGRDTSPVRIAMPVARSKEPEIEAPEERHEPPALPTGIGRTVPDEEELTEEPAGHDPARGAGVAMAEASFGANAPTQYQGSGAGGKRALIQYDYEKAEDNELELVEGEYVTNIEMVDDDWWMGTNQKGESGLFPSNYVELVEGEEEEAPAPVSHAPEPVAPAQAPRPAAAPAAPAAPAGPTAKALYDYEAAEDNELSFPEEATITGLVCSLSSNIEENANMITGIP